MLDSNRVLIPVKQGITRRQAAKQRTCSCVKHSLQGLGDAMKITSAASGAATGAKVGSTAGPVGTAVGAVVGLAASLFAGGKKISKAEATWDSFKNQLGTGAFSQLTDASAGEVYKGAHDTNSKFFKLGRADYVQWLCNALKTGVANGSITADMDAQQIADKVIYPQMQAYGSKGSTQNRFVAEMILRLFMGGGIPTLMEKGVGKNVVMCSGLVFPSSTTSVPVSSSSSATPQPTAIIPLPMPAPQIQKEPGSGAQYGTNTGVVAPVSMLNPTSETQALIDSLLSQGASNQQAFTSAMNLLQQRGVDTSTPQVQQAVADQVSAVTKPDYLPWAIGGAVGLGFLFLAMNRRR